jgi:hypothetical protein
MPLAFGLYPKITNLADEGIHLQSNGVNANYLFACSSICGASVVSIFNLIK